MSLGPGQVSPSQWVAVPPYQGGLEAGWWRAGRVAMASGAAEAGQPRLHFSSRYSTWEPEEHILDPRLVLAYEEK